MSRRLLLVLGVALPLLFAACSTTKPKTTTAPEPEPRQGRYAMDRDAAPLRPISPDEVQDAVPRPDPLLALGNMSPYEVNGVRYRVLDEYRGYREEGTASWYGAKFHGHATSNGETYDLYLASAAHKTLPIPSYARVTNLDNGRSVVVRVNDRGPFHSERLIDLSYAAAVKLGYMESGTARVRVETIDLAGVDDRRDVPGGQYRYLQLGAFGAESSARRLQGELEAFVNAPVTVSEVEAGGNVLYRVRIGPVADIDELELVQRQLQDVGYDGAMPLP